MKISVSDTGLDFIKDLKRSKKEEKGYGADIVSEVDSEGDSVFGENCFPNLSKSRLTGTSRSILGSRRKILDLKSPKNSKEKEILKERHENNTSIKIVNEGRNAFLKRQNTALKHANSISQVAVSLSIRPRNRNTTNGSKRSRQ